MAAKNPTDEPDPAPFKVHLLTRAGRLMRARSEPVRAFATKDEAVRFAGRQLATTTRCTTRTEKFGRRPRVCLQLGELYARTDRNQTQNTSTGVALGIERSRSR